MKRRGKDWARVQEGEGGGKDLDPVKMEAPEGK